MKKLFYLFAILLVLSFVYLETKTHINVTQSYELPNVIIKNKLIKVVLADDMQKQIDGLSNKPKLKDDEGMLFVFDTKQKRTFWMKQMNFPLDIIWIEDNKIVNISKNLAPEGDSPTNKYSSQYDINYVLEVNAGFADNNHIKIGDFIQYNNITKN